MIKKHDILLIWVTLILTVGMIVIYDMSFAKPKPVAIVDIKGLTDEFLSFATKSHLTQEQMNELVTVFTSSLEEGIEQLSVDHVLLSKRAVVSNELDLTGDLRNYIAGKITKQVPK